MIVILPHTYHFTGFVLSVSTDCVAVKCEDAFTQYLEDYSTWQIGETRTIKVVLLFSKRMEK